MVRCGDSHVKVRMLDRCQNTVRRFDHLAGHHVIEAVRPVEADVGTAPLNEAKIMHDVAARDDHYVLLTQSTQLDGEVKVIVQRL